MAIPALTDNYIPDDILYRCEQSKQIEKVFLSFKRLGMGANLILSGSSGVGKTVTLRKVLKEANGDFILVNGSSTENAEKTIRACMSTGFKNMERALSELVQELQAHPKIIIIDEVNRIKDVPYLFDLLNTIYRETSVPIIVITNQPRLLSQMADDARGTLLFERIDFAPYDAEQLYEILKARIGVLQSYLINVPELSLRHICSIAAYDGSARKVISIAGRCLVEGDFTIESIKRVSKRMEEEEWREIYNTLSPSEKCFLKTCLDLHASGQDINHENLLPLLPFNPQRVSQLMTRFSNDLYILKSHYVNYGRAGGRKRIVNFISQEVFTKLDGVAV